MLKILLVEDNLIDRMAFVRMVEKEALECKLEVAENVREAKRWLRSDDFQLVICDLNLPDGTAFDLSVFFRQYPFILLSGHVDAELKEKTRLTGIFKVFSKSSNLSQFPAIATVIKQMLGKKVTFKKQRKPQAQSDSFAPILAQLKSTFDDNAVIIAEIIRSFLLENPKILDRLSLAADIGDTPQIVRTAHQLKSGYMMMGLKDLQQLSADLELNCPSKNENLREQIQAIIEQSHQSYISLNAALLELDCTN